MKYAPGLMVGQLSGSTGSTTAGRNRFASYFRSRVIPVNPNSVAQQGVRGLFGGFAQQWRTLTASERQAWTDLAPNVPRTNSLGQSYVLTGANLFASVNLNRDAVGDAPITAAPTLDSAPVVTALLVGADGTITGDLELLIGTAVSGGTANNNLIVRASAPRSPGRDYISRSELKQIHVLAGNQSFAADVDITAQYERVFGGNWVTQVGMEIAVELAPVSENGFAGTPVRYQVIIT